MKYYSFLFFLFTIAYVKSQSQLNDYPWPPLSVRSELHNDDYSVRAKSLGGSWKNLYEYKSYINSGGRRGENEGSSFVTFDFSGSVTLEITSNRTSIDKVLIRPKSKNLPYTKSGNKIFITIDKPQQLSIEINGNRYRGLHVFANEIHTPPDLSDPLVTVFRSNEVHYLTAIDPSPNTHTTEDKYEIGSNRTIYIEPGAIIRGTFSAHDKDNIKILGRGIIDLTYLDKCYSSECHSEQASQSSDDPDDDIRNPTQGVLIRRSSNVVIDGLIINDPQVFGIAVTESSNLNLNNIKIFTRTLFGDGIDIAASNNININNTFIRSADDCIAIYSTRIRSFNGYPEGNSYNIKTENTILYADQSRPINIGSHGNRENNNGNSIFNIIFRDIDILDQDERLSDYRGAISINCGDENSCFDFQFNNINVEEMSNGRLFNIRVVDPTNQDSGAHTPGQKIRNISFTNFNFTGDLSEISRSRITGINYCSRAVDGIHFQDFKINGTIIRDTEQFNFLRLKSHAYNITFQEANNFSNEVGQGTYKIFNKSSRNVLSHSTENNSDFSSLDLSPVVVNNDLNLNHQKWKILKVPNASGQYYIKNILTDEYLIDTNLKYIYDCKGSYTATSPGNESSRKRWKIVRVGTSDAWSIINIYTRAYLFESPQDVPGFSSKRTITSENENKKRQQWFLNYTTANNNRTADNLKVNEEYVFKGYPNPVNQTLFLNIPNHLDNLSLKVYNSLGVEVLKSDSIAKILDFSSLNNGIYFLNLIDKNGDVLYTDKVLKN